VREGYNNSERISNKKKMEDEKERDSNPVLLKE